MKKSFIGYISVLLILSSCEKEEDNASKLISRTKPVEVEVTKPKVNFNAYINVDSGSYVNVLSVSENTVKQKWYLDGTYMNDQLWASFYVGSSKSFVKIKLVCEDTNGYKDSLTKTIQMKDYQIDFNNCHFLLKSINPVTYSFHHTREQNKYGVSGLCFGSIYTNNLIPFRDGYEKTFENSVANDVIYYLSLPDRIAYKRVKTFNLSEYLDLLSYISGEYLFEERYATEKVNVNTSRIDFRDSILNLTQINTTRFVISDTTLKHYFEGYLSSYTNDATIDIRMPKVNTPETGYYYYSYMRFPRNSTKIIAEKYSSSGVKVSNSSRLNYNGRKL